MKSIFKAGLLVSLLAIPVLIYLFLQIFGQNYYSLPIYYQNNATSAPDDCTNFTEAQQVDWSNIQKYSSQLNLNNEKITVFAAISDDCDQECQIKFNQASRLANNYVNQDSLQIVVVIINEQSSDTSEIKKPTDLNNLKFVNLNVELWRQFSHCELLLPYSDISEVNINDQFVLLDGKSRIRGYYNGLSLEDIDRLTTEIRLLLYEYQHQT
ncbi:MAG: hypothetical protein ACOCXH_00485 [Cyclobacteriaceae bacterium]